jgi:hypothetical protein
MSGLWGVEDLEVSRETCAFSVDGCRKAVDHNFIWDIHTGQV